MSYYGYIVKIDKLREHPNADKLQIATFFGNDTCIGLEAQIGDIGVYFPCDGQLSVEFCLNNHLLRKLPDGTPDTGYMDPDKRNVKAIKLRGEKSDGIYLPISCLDYCFGESAAAHFKVGDRLDVANGHAICTKYIPRTNHRIGKPSDGNRTRKKKAPIAPLFNEHADTEQLAYNLGAFKPGDEIEITLKMHGTSQRTGYLPVFKGYKRSLWDKITRKEGTPIYDWDYITGTRRTVLDSFDGGFYGSNEFREQYHEFFKNRLQKGEEVFYEVVGFTHTGTSIMAECSNKKMNDKEFIKQYGDTTTFSYGCHPQGWNNKDMGYNLGHCEPQSDIYVYRMTMTNEDGFVVEYTPDFMRYRCEQMGVKTVPVMWRGYADETIDWNDAGMTAGEWIKDKAEEFYDGPDPIGKTHIREGVVVRILNRPKFCAYKHKNFAFKVLEGIIKETAEAPDMEEADGLDT
jgi:hypothetical protein